MRINLRRRAARHWALGPVRLRDRPQDGGLALPGDAGAAGQSFFIVPADGHPAGSNSPDMPAMVVAAARGAGLSPGRRSAIRRHDRQARLRRRRGRRPRPLAAIRFLPRGSALSAPGPLRRLLSASRFALSAGASARPSITAGAILTRGRVIDGCGYNPAIRRYTVYKSTWTWTSSRRADNASLFEGQAKARSPTDEMGVLVPNLIEAMFTGFPGRSGETVKITIPARKS